MSGKASEKYSWRGNGLIPKLGMTPPPCWNNGEDCQKRYVGCRAECDEWHEYLAIHERETEEIRRKKYDERAAESYMVEGRIRAMTQNYRKYKRDKRRAR